MAMPEIKRLACRQQRGLTALQTHLNGKAKSAIFLRQQKSRPTVKAYPDAMQHPRSCIHNLILDRRFSSKTSQLIAFFDWLRYTPHPTPCLTAMNLTEARSAMTLTPTGIDAASNKNAATCSGLPHGTVTAKQLLRCLPEEG